MSKYNGLTKKKREERLKKREGGVGQVLASGVGQMQKFINEWTEKFNALGKQVDAVFKIATTEVGKIWANEQRMVESIDHIDVNILSLAELNKQLVKRLHTQNEIIKKLCEMAELEMPAVDEAASKTEYEELMKAAFAVVLERRQKEDEERKAAREKEALEAKAAEDAKTEAEKAEKALKEAETEFVTDLGAGGKGSEIPEGAQVFGG